MVGKILNFGLASPIDIQIQGKNVQENYKLAQKMLADVKKIRGVADAHIHQITDTPEIKIDVDKTRASMMHLSQETVSRNVLTALTSSGQVAPNYWVDPTNGVNYTLALRVPQFDVDTVKNVTDIPVASAMILGMLPMALGIGEGGEQNAPIGRTVIGGLLFATFATLVIVPLLFAIMNKNKKFEVEKDED